MKDNNANTTKNRPTHQLTFAERKVDHQGNVTMGKAFNVGAVWERKNGKQGGILSWDMSPSTLGDGQYTLISNKENQTSETYSISFSEKRPQSEKDTSLGRPVDIASVDKNGLIDWSISPERLNDGAYFVLEDHRGNTRQQEASKADDAFNQAESSGKAQSQSLGR